jgi:hypothetical protein
MPVLHFPSQDFGHSGPPVNLGPRPPRLPAPRPTAPASRAAARTPLNPDIFRAPRPQITDGGYTYQGPPAADPYAPNGGDTSSVVTGGGGTVGGSTTDATADSGAAPAATGLGALVDYLKSIPLWVIVALVVVALFIIFRKGK